LNGLPSHVALAAMFVEAIVQLIEAFFGVFWLIGIVACGLAWMFSAHHGVRIAARIGTSVVLFTIGMMLVPRPGTSLLIGAVQIVVGLVLLIGAIFALVNGRRAARNK
jgi:hypothetical protein